MINFECTQTRTLTICPVTIHVYFLLSNWRDILKLGSRDLSSYQWSKILHFNLFLAHTLDNNYNSDFKELKMAIKKDTIYNRYKWNSFNSLVCSDDAPPPTTPTYPRDLEYMYNHAYAVWCMQVLCKSYKKGLGQTKAV